MKYKGTGKIRFLSIFVAILCLILLHGMPHSDAANSDSEYKTFRLEPVEDAYVDSEEPYTNFGEDGELKVEYYQYGNAETNAFSYLKFDLSALPANYRVLDSTLKIWVDEMSSGMEGVIVYSSSNNWSEMDIRYVNRPDFLGDNIKSTFLTGSSGKASISLNDYITKDTPRTITLGLAKGDDGWISFYSNDSYLEPELVINVEILNQPPEADFYYSPSKPTDLDTITFDDYSIDADGDITSYEWDFGDGNTSQNQNPSHSYSENGTYEVTLTVKDNDDATDTKSKTITVNNVQPTANFNYIPESPVKINTTLNFTDNSNDPDGEIVNCTWNFKDGTTGYGQTTNHTYTAPGTYDVTLIVTDDDGDTDTYVSAITVEEEKEGGTPGFGLALLVMATATILIFNRRKRNGSD